MHLLMQVRDQSRAIETNEPLLHGAAAQFPNPEQPFRSGSKLRAVLFQLAVRVVLPIPNNFAAISLSPFSCAIAPRIVCFSISNIGRILVSADVTVSCIGAPVIELGKSTT